MHVVLTGGMDELLPVTADYDMITDRMRQFAAARYMEMISSLSDHVAQALSDPAGIHDTEPGRIQAYAALVKLQASLIKELGLLYRVQDRPPVPEEEQEETVTLVEHEEALRLAQEREDRAVAAAAELATQAALAAVAHREVLDLDVARQRVANGLKALGR